MTKLNMEEKKKLEKLIVGDIESARARIIDERCELSRRLEKNPPAVVVRLFKTYKANLFENEEITKLIGKQHYYFYGHADNLKVNSDHPQLVKFGEDQTRRQAKLSEILKAFTIKIYSENGGMEAVLKDLAQELAKL